MKTVTVANMNSDLKVVNETKIGKETDERIKRPDLSEQTEDTSDGTGSDDTDVKSAVPVSSRLTEVMKDKESKHCDVKGPGERICKETCPSENHNYNTPELRAWA